MYNNNNENFRYQNNINYNNTQQQNGNNNMMMNGGQGTGPSSQMYGNTNNNNMNSPYGNNNMKGNGLNNNAMRRNLASMLPPVTIRHPKLKKIIQDTMVKNANPNIKKNILRQLRSLIKKEHDFRESYGTCYHTY